MINLFNFFESRFPAIKKIIWKAIYNFLAWRFPTSEWFFMNYGYDNPEDELNLLPEDEKNRYFIHLYAHTLSQVELSGRDILEIGSGRGGGSEWIARTQNVSSMTGLDLSDSAVNLCNKNHKVPNLAFKQGDAEQLPFPDKSFDIVLNVESCHHYPNLGTFLQEVKRVLRPGGYLCLADYRERTELDEFKEQLSECDLELIRSTNITGNVVNALNLTDHLKLSIMQRYVPWFLLDMVKTFASVKGTELYNRFVDGRVVYISAMLQKNPAT
ncbi:class I SAM-dependent methyltransferase [Moorena bouillonii]|uniref:Methyltransferase type 11 domain-containing protein n=1 Tax=Moorena bouillonii PNG TaxID=568701 RepID=A0A1U7N6P5_9CYAN|nr:class I SAM-dependent methyltransferase [Moorena bouillonii]OLT61623.1 hypothetical protein BJP37_23980 [Moorena bouillonii PNG]